ncbi:hypothetical protein [Bacillus manliponensis]|nr:hypothetical protein [Bacillus manliponensis]
MKRVGDMKKKRIILIIIRYVCLLVGLMVYTFNNGDSPLSTLFLFVGVMTIFIEDYHLGHRKNFKKNYKEIIPLSIILCVFFLPISNLSQALLFFILLTISTVFSLKGIEKEAIDVK